MLWKHPTRNANEFGNNLPEIAFHASAPGSGGQQNLLSNEHKFQLHQLNTATEVLLFNRPKARKCRNWDWFGQIFTVERLTVLMPLALMSLPGMSATNPLQLP